MINVSVDPGNPEGCWVGAVATVRCENSRCNKIIVIDQLPFTYPKGWVLCDYGRSVKTFCSDKCFRRKNNASS